MTNGVASAPRTEDDIIGIRDAEAGSVQGSADLTSKPSLLEQAENAHAEALDYTRSLVPEGVLMTIFDIHVGTSKGIYHFIKGTVTGLWDLVLLAKKPCTNEDGIWGKIGTLAWDYKWELMVLGLPGFDPLAVHTSTCPGGESARRSRMAGSSGTDATPPRSLTLHGREPVPTDGKEDELSRVPVMLAMRYT